MTEAKSQPIAREVVRRLDSLQQLTKLSRARCIGMLEAEYETEHRARMDELQRQFELIEKVKP